MELLSSVVASTLLPAAAVLIAGGAMLAYRAISTHIKQSRDAALRSHLDWRSHSAHLRR